MNNFSTVATIVKAPESIKLGERPGMRVRLVDKTYGKKAVDRFFTGIFSGQDLDVLARLKVGDQIFVSGGLIQEEYTNKAGVVVKDDNMPYAKLLQVAKSASFFAKKEEADDVQATAAPDLTAPAGPSPLDGI